MTYSCPGCGKVYELQLSDTWALVCTQCRGIVFGENRLKTYGTQMPEDWNWLTQGSIGVCKDHKFILTGRVRIQTKNEVKNLWCATNGKESFWLGHSLDAMAIYNAFKPVSVLCKKKPVGELIDIGNSIKLRCESQEDCMYICYEGELSVFPVINNEFALIQASNSTGNNALLFRTKNENVHLLWGEYVTPSELKIENIVVWDGWK